jgi:hypothetical protein
MTTDYDRSLKDLYDAILLLAEEVSKLPMTRESHLIRNLTASALMNVEYLVKKDLD